MTGCLDLFHDVLLEAQVRLDRVPSDARSSIEYPARYAHTVVTRLLVDRVRRERVSRGFPARPGRLDGSARRVREALEKADPERADWLVALFRMLQAYAHKVGRTAAVWPLDGWTVEKSRYDSRPRAVGPESRDEIRSDIAEVIRTASDALGPGWVHLNIHHPLLCAMRPEAIDEAIAAPAIDLEVVVLSSWLRSEYIAKRIQGHAPIEALRHAALVVTGATLTDATPEVWAALRELDDELEASA